MFTPLSWSHYESIALDFEGVGFKFYFQKRSGPPGSAWIRPLSFIYIVEPLCKLVNKSICEGIFPYILKIAKAIPIYKSNEKCNVSNYRPISLLSSISNILEKVMHNRLYSFFQTNKMFYENQYCFRKQRSTVDAVTKFINDVIKNYDDRQSTIAVYCDLSKAFNTIDHNILIHKL